MTRHCKIEAGDNNNNKKFAFLLIIIINLASSYLTALKQNTNNEKKCFKF